VGINAAGKQILAADIDLLGGGAELLTDLLDAAALDADIGDEFLGMGDDGTVAQDEIHVSIPLLGYVESCLG
jgi:hypothetical protein